jgi:hypothetical protein
MSSRYFAVPFALLAFGCRTPQEDASTPDLSLVRAQLDTLWAQYSAAAVAGDGDAITRLYTDSPYLVESGLATIKDRAVLRSVVKDVLSGVRFLESSIRPEHTEWLGEQVAQFGQYRDVLQTTGQPAQVTFGRFAAILKRDSTWRVSRLVAVADSTVPLPPKQE